MPQRLSYADAVRILGGKGPLAKAIDNLLGVALSVATAGGSDLAISLFDAKTEAVRLGELVTAQINDSVRGLGRHQRSERLQAAHAVLVVAAFFEAFDDCVTDAGVGNPGFDHDEQLRFVSESSGNTPARRRQDAPPAWPPPLGDAVRQARIWRGRPQRATATR